MLLPLPEGWRVVVVTLRRTPPTVDTNSSRPSPQDRKLRSIRAKISNYKNSVFPSVAGLIHKAKDPQ